MEINNKYKIGDKVYSISKKAINESCDVCNGDKVIIVKNSKIEKEMECAYCNGRGYVRAGREKYVVDSGVCTVTSFKVAVGQKDISIKYVLLREDGRKINRSEFNVFENLDFAENRCEELNYIEQIPQKLNANTKEIKNLVDVYISNGYVLKNGYKNRHCTSNEDIEKYIMENKNICIEDNDEITFYTNDEEKKIKFIELIENSQEKRYSSFNINGKR